MLIIFIQKSRNANDATRETDDKETFHKHDEEMKKFRLDHPELEEPATDAPVSADNFLVPVHSVKLGRNSQN